MEFKRKTLPFAIALIFSMAEAQAVAIAANDADAANAEKPATPSEPSAASDLAIQIQVLASSVAVFAQPSNEALVIAQVTRGTMISALERRGDWFKISVSANTFGWILLGEGEYGEANIALFYDANSGKNPTRLLNRDTSEITPARPGNSAPLLVALPSIDPQQVAPPQPHLPRESISVPDRWRLMQALGFKFPWYDPYNQNQLKGDLPVLKSLGSDFFFNLGVISETNLEFRRLPIPVAGQISTSTGANNVFGRGQQSGFVQNLIVSLGLIKGDTTFRPPDYEFRFVPVFNFNRARVQEAGALNIDPSRGKRRNDNFLGVQELFVDKHLRNVSDRYDFDSLRVGIQPFTNDFRGFLFQDVPFGARLFGNRDNNRWQYNLAWFRRIEKDTNSGLNDLGKGLRDDDVFIANLYRQDFPFIGFTSQVSAVHNRNRETEKAYDSNGFLVRPAFLGDLRGHRYNVTYLGYSGDGHLGKWNLATSTYVALGNDERSPIAHRKQNIRAAFHASELSHDFDWIRVRGSLVLASGDKNPYDGKSTGFDAIFENPQIAGSDTSFAIRQAIPLIGGGGVALSGRNGILQSLRSSKDEGQSNFVNPGLALIGAGADADVLPELRVFGNVSYLRFMNVSSLQALRTQAIPSRNLGLDFSTGIHWRPYFNQNLVINGSLAALRPGKGLKALYGERQGTLYSIAFSAIVSY